MNKNEHIYIAGHEGLIGTVLLKKLKRNGFKNLIIRSHRDLDLTEKEAVKIFFEKEKIDYVFLLSAKTGGIVANDTYSADFLYTNLMIAANVIHYAWLTGVKKFLYPGCACIYPYNTPQPMKEEYLLTGPFEKTSEAYSIAKVSGIKMCQMHNKQFGTNFVTCISTNVYGPGDNFNLHTSHVIPALIKKVHAAKIRKRTSVVIWGTGKPKREFIYVDDVADAFMFLMDKYNDSKVINIGSGEEISIIHLVELIKEVVGFNGEIEFDATKPDGVERKTLDSSRIKKLGWGPDVLLKEGLFKIYRWFLENIDGK